MVGAMKNRLLLAIGVLGVGVVGGCSAGSSSPSAGSTSPTTRAGSGTTVVVPTTAVATTGTPVCPTLVQANTALGGSYSGPVQNNTPGGGIVCAYTGGAGTAGVTIFAHQSASVYAGQVAHAPGAPAMAAISGVGDGAYGQDVGGRAVLNAYSNSSRTLVAAQASGALGPVEALARVALADN
jgi:hypothetical protein